MAAFLLWNVNKKPLDGMVQSLVRQHRIDIVLLVEYAFGVSQLPVLLASDGLIKRPSPKRFGVFARATHGFARLRYFSRPRYPLGPRALFLQWVPPSGVEGLIVLVHGLDRRNHDESTRRLFFREVAEGVRRCEGRRGHGRTIITGDFNAQPFESAVADADGLHAIGVQCVEGSFKRRIRGAARDADFFYNPMWRTYGHHGHSEAGAATYHWLGRKGHELGWYMVDQVVLRPEESARFPENELQIVTHVGGTSLLDAKGRPDLQTASDHLPLVFHWNL